MANTLGTLAPDFWAREAQRSLFVENKAMIIANTTLRNLLAGEGDVVNRVILSHPAAETYTPGTDLSNPALTSTSPSLTVATWFASRVTIDDTEKKQSIIEIGREVARRMMHNHNNRIEQAVLYEVFSATWSIDDGNVGGTAGSNISLTSANVPQVFVAADTKLDAIDAPSSARIAVVGGHFLGQLKLQQAARATNFGDVVNARGEVGQLFGWKIIYSNNLPWLGVLTMTTNPSNLDTVTIAGVVFTFRTTLGTTAGSVLIGADANGSQVYLVAAINDTNTAGTGLVDTHYVQLATENRFLLRDKRRLSAINSGTTIRINGFGDIVVSEALTPAASVWSAQRQNCFFASAGSVHQIVQIPPLVEVTRDPDQFADIVKSLLGYGVATFADGAREIVDVRVSAATSDWA